MTDPDNILKILTYMGITSIPLIALIIIILILIYPKCKVLFGDILKLIGGISKSIRKLSIESDIEGTIDTFTFSFNDEMLYPTLPQCKVKWIDEKNLRSTLIEGKAIVCVSFDKFNHDLNYYNAAFTFIKTALLPRTKNFLNKTTANAIDLLMTKILLKTSKRESLKIFNDEFIDLDDNCKEIFFRLEETDEKGLFRRMLLQELHFFGELFTDETPKDCHIEETEKFIDWFYMLATREDFEKSSLSFVSEHIKLGVILIASDDTYNRYGQDPYLKRANIYSSNDYKIIYFLARGSKRGAILEEIAKELIITGCYEKLTKKTKIRRIDSNNNELLITCIALKPNKSNIINNAWKRLEKDFDENRIIKAEIQYVNSNSIIIDSYGLQITIPKGKLSKLKLQNIYNYFKKFNTLSLKIESMDILKKEISLSNVDTVTDPIHIVELLRKSVNKIINSRIESILKTSEGFEKGIIIKFEKQDVIKGFIPRRNATFSRFTVISEKYKIDDALRVIPENFDIYIGEYICSMPEIKDPWNSINKYSENKRYSTIIREITENYITCELEEGIEGKILLHEISWNNIEHNKEEIKNYNPGDEIETLLLKIDRDNRINFLSLKKLVDSPTKIFYESNKKQIFKAKIEKLVSYGAFCKIINEKEKSIEIQGFIPINEIIWGYVDYIDDYLNNDDIEEVILLDYYEKSNSITCSIKQCEENSYIDFYNLFNVNDIVTGKIKSIESNVANVEISFSEGKVVNACIYKSQISNNFYVNNIEEYLDLSKEYKFCVKRFDKYNGIVELSRVILYNLKKNEIEYGKEYIVDIKKIKRKYIVIGQFFEGYLIYEDFKSINKTNNLNVIPAKISDDIITFTLIS